MGERLSAAEDEGGGERVEEREVCADAEPLLQGEGCDCVGGSEKAGDGEAGALERGVPLPPAPLREGAALVLALPLAVPDAVPGAVAEAAADA